MADWIVQLIESVGLPGIAVLMFLEIPIPLIQSEIVMTFAGFTASKGELNVFLVVLAGVTGSQVGSLALYGAVRPLSEERVRRFLADHGAWLGFELDDLRSAQERFDRHDHWAVLIGRLVPGLRSFVAIPAGIQGMPVAEFFLLNLVGTVVWTSVLTYLGTLLGDNYRLVDQYSSYITYALVALVAGWVVTRAIKVARSRWDREPEQRDNRDDQPVGSG